jgi:RNA polymerase sigma factor (sigma-70 family)
VTAEATPLTDRSAGGRPDAVEELHRLRFADAVRLAHLLSGDASVAEDLAQEAFVRVRERLDGVDAPWAYLRAAVVNACRSHHRSRGREAVRLRLRLVGAATESQLGARELLDAVDALPYRQKAVIVLRYYEDLSEHDIARALGCRPGTVKSLASRALQHLAKEVER